MDDWQPRRYKEYEWIVADPELLGGKLAIRGTRLFGVNYFYPSTTTISPHQ
jgi:hypothetical protein